MRSYPTVERNGLIMSWYHPEGVAPMWEIPEIEEFNDPDNFTEMVMRDYLVEAPWQELAENGVDAAHFRYVHHTEEVPELESYEVDGPRTKMRSIQKFPTPRGIVDGRIDADSHGPGFSKVRFSGIVETLLMGCNTPIDDTRCHMRFSFTVRKLGDDSSLNSTVGQAFVDEIHKQVQEDKPIWENKAHLVRPALADTDGPVMKFRKWAAQFYAEGTDEFDARLRPAGQLSGRAAGNGVPQVRVRSVQVLRSAARTHHPRPAAPAHDETGVPEPTSTGHPSTAGSRRNRRAQPTSTAHPTPPAHDESRR